jgi:hypothetical protein
MISWARPRAKAGINTLPPAATTSTIALIKSLSWLRREGWVSAT